MSKEDRNYYQMRAVTARRLAENAADKQIANIHHEMALRYDALCRPTAGDPEKAAA